MAASRPNCPAPLDRKIPAIKSWCHTRLGLLKFSYTWTINNFSLRKEKPGEFLESSTFPDGNYGIKWNLRMFPRGEIADTTTAVFVYLVSSNKPELYATFQFSISNSRGQQITQIQKKPAAASITPGKRIGRRIDRSMILPEDKLLIVCEICEVGESMNVAGEGDPLLWELPKCTLAEDFHKLFLESKFSDVTLSASGTEFKVHKNILAARSRVFSSMFNHPMTESKNNRVEIEDVEPDVLLEMLRYIYTGKTRPLKNSGLTSRLLGASDKYELERLKVICESSLCSELSIETAAEAMILAYLHSAEQLKADAIRFMAEHASEVKDTEGFKAMMTSYPQLIVEAFVTVAAKERPAPIEEDDISNGDEMLNPQNDIDISDGDEMLNPRNDGYNSDGDEMLNPRDDSDISDGDEMLNPRDDSDISDGEEMQNPRNDIDMPDEEEMQNPPNDIDREIEGW